MNVYFINLKIISLKNISLLVHTKNACMGSTQRCNVFLIESQRSWGHVGQILYGSWSKMIAEWF